MPRKFDFVSPGVQITEIDQSKIETPLQDDGLLVIGRATTGPALKPVKINSLENFIDVFGKPISGKGTVNADVWRDGNNQGPTYAMYAAQAWLASNTSPVTFIRLLGEDSPSASGIKAGWDMGGAAISSTPSANRVAYGLFICPSASAGTLLNGTLAAVFYTSGSALTLSGTVAGGKYPSAEKVTSSAGMFIKSIATGGKPSTFKLEVSDGAAQNGGVAWTPKSFIFHFDPDEKTSYIRNIVNTNPQKLFGTNVPSAQQEKYFLGETYEEAVNRIITNTATAGNQYGILLPLQSGSAAANSLLFHQAQATTSKTGWVINRNPDPISGRASYQADNMKKLFRLVSLSEGEYFERNYYVSIEDIQLGTVANPNSSFTVKIRNTNDDVVEQFSNLNLDESSENFIGKRIGDMFQTWDSNKKRYELYGEYTNQSNYVRVEMADDWKNSGVDDVYMLPFGFFGPVQPKGFMVVSGSSTAKPIQTPSGDFVAAAGTINTYARGNLSAITYGNTTTEHFVMFPWAGSAANALTQRITASLTFPRLKLTENNTAKSGTNYNAKDLFGLNHKFAGKNSRHVLSDRSYIDLLRYQGGGIDLHSATHATQYSFVFSLDDVREASGKWYWQSGSMKAGTSFASTQGTLGLLTSSVKQFALPLFGGFDGVDVTQIDPFSSKNVLDNYAETTHYANYSVQKAIDSISDSEVVAYDVVSMPGLTNTGLSNNLINAVEDRGDALAIIDLDDQYKETYENSGTRTGGSIDDVKATARTRDLNTSYAAAYYPRVRLRDTLSGNGDVFIAPSSVAAIGALAHSDANSDGPWFAPAGFNRGGISILGGNQGPRVAGTWKNLPKSDRDELYELNINPIARFPAVGEIVIFGQKTLQQTPSALDRINVRRLMVYLKKRIGNIADTLLFDQNVEATWSRFKSRADLVLSDVQARLGISEYKLVLDTTTTTPDLVDQNIMYAKIFVKPARAIEFIAIDFIITKTGVEF